MVIRFYDLLPSVRSVALLPMTRLCFIGSYHEARDIIAKWNHKRWRWSCGGRGMRIVAASVTKFQGPTCIPPGGRILFSEPHRLDCYR